MPRTRLLAEWLAILAVTLLAAAWASSSRLTKRLDNAILDRALVAGAPSASDEIVIVAIDERSLAVEGQWPWSRGRVASLIDRIGESDPKAILLDVLFTEPSDAQADQALAASLARSGKVALPIGHGPAKDSTAGTAALMPIPELARTTFAIGHVGIQPDEDGTVRRIVPALEVLGGKPVPHLSLALHQALGGKPLTPSGAAGALRLRPAGSFRTVPASSVLSGEVPAQFLSGKIVIVGATAQGLGDNFPVSSAAGSMMSGSELLANSLQDLAQSGFVRPLSPAASLGLTAGFIAILFAAFWMLRPVWCLWTALACALASLLLAYVLAFQAGLWFAPGPVLLALVIAYPLWGWRRLAAINDYLMAKADRLSGDQATSGQKHDGFDAVARAVNRLDFLVDELSERRAFLGRVVESTPDALFVFDSAGKLLTLNRRAMAIIGAPSGELQGQGVSELVARVDGRLTDDGGELHLGDGRVFVITRSTGVPQAQWSDIHLAMLTDVTDQRRAEAERRHALEFLSHDMRSPQVAILGLTSEREGNEAPETRFARIRRHARRTLELADNFVELARLGDAPIDLTDTDLGALADEAADRAFTLARDQGASVEVTYVDDPVFAWGDGAILSRVLDNLVGNALKYGATSVILSVSRRQSLASIDVVDDGPGLPPERADDPFLRFGARSNEGKAGAGLGLAFVAAAVARHGGTIACTSVPGQGTSFRIELPLSGE